MVSQERLKQLLIYDPISGIWTWGVARKNNQIRVGSLAGRLDKKGYRAIGIDGKNYYAHRLAFLWMTGNMPEQQVDHINGIKDDNRWSNLREATNRENSQNIDTFRSNTSGYNGVYLNKSAGKWVAHIKDNGKYHYLGLYDTPELANEARLNAQKSLWTFQPKPRIHYE